MILDKAHEVNGIIVFVHTAGKVYIPRDAATVFEQAMQY